jgi:hypothetical protein
MDYLEAGANIIITASYQVEHSTFQLHVVPICQYDTDTHLGYCRPLFKGLNQRVFQKNRVKTY